MSSGSLCGVLFLLCVCLQDTCILGLYHGPEYRPPRALVLDITSRSTPHPAHALQEPRLPLPTPQDLDTIKKVAQILVLLGEKVIPSILGETPSSASATEHVATDSHINPLNNQH